jgi:hypothetical protein
MQKSKRWKNNEKIQLKIQQKTKRQLNKLRNDLQLQPQLPQGGKPGNFCNRLEDLVVG